MAQRVITRPLPAWVGDLPVYERTLDNGLKALVLPRSHAPIVVCDLYYPVGSVHEPPGKTGLAHFVEHLLFKGTSRLPRGQIDRLAFLAAGQSNAETGEDCSHYWFAFPQDRWELALEIESDRMFGATFGPEDVEAERRVIAEERARDLDTPLGRLDQMHLTVSYRVHPYRNPVLGWPEDVSRLTVEDLTAFYRRHYRPDGAVLVVVGNVEPAEALGRVEAYFGHLPRPGRRPALVLPEEPPQEGRREFYLVESESVSRGLLGWHTVPRLHPDGPALEVLGDLLTYGRRARLWERLVERDRLATYIEASHESGHLAGQFLIQVEAAPGVEPARVEAVIREELERFAASGPTQEELARSRNRLEAAWRWEQEDLAGLAAGLGYVALWADWRCWQEEHRAALAVTPEEIRRVAATYLVDRTLTVGWSVPRATRSELIHAAAVSPPTAMPVTPPAAGEGAERSALRTAVPALEYQPRRTVLSNGLRLIAEHRPDTGTIALDLYVDAGQLREAKPGLAALVGRWREEGTATRSAEAISAQVEDAGGTLEVTATGLSLRIRAEDLPMALEVMADLTCHAAFPPGDLPWLKRRIVAELQGDRDDPAYRADMIFRGLVYGKHPLGRDPRGHARQIAALTRDDVLAHHARFFVPRNAFLVAVGDFDPRRLKAQVEQAFGDWEDQGEPAGPWPEPQAIWKPRHRRVSFAGSQVHIVLGHLGVARLDPDYEALVVLDHIFGSGPGFADRLSRTLREEQGLAYSVGGGITDSADLVPGLFRVYLGTGPAEADQAIALVKAQVAAMHEGAFSDEEVDRARRYLAGAWVFDFQTVSQRADRLLELERWGLPLEEPLKWADRVSRIEPEQVRAAARRHLHPEALVVVEFGPVRPRRKT